LTVRAAAELLGMSRETLYRWLRREAPPMPVEAFGKEMRVRRSSIDRYRAGLSDPAANGHGKPRRRRRAS
jgi:excisionase family DNA binding protein